MPLPIARHHNEPAPGRAPVLDATLNFRDGRSKALPVPHRLQAVDRFAAGAAQAAQENTFDEGGKIGENKTMPPEGLLAAGTRGGLHPGKFSAETSNFIDVGSNGKYQ